jgi:cell division septation protein DedD
MTDYFLSYSPNDFFWVSVSGEYDLTQCENLLNPPTKPPRGMTTNVQENEIAAACACPNDPTVTTLNSDTVARGRSGTRSTKNSSRTSHSSHSDPMYVELCKNYVNSKKLMNRQTEASAGNEMTFDMDSKYAMQVNELFNICIGILAMGLVMMSSTQASTSA